MDLCTARPPVLKQANLSFVRKVIKNKGSATRAEIALETNISSTTIRSLLLEMQQNGEIESLGYDQSSGGRKAERYRFKKDRYYGVAFCIMEHAIHYLLVNICGEIVENGSLHSPETDPVSSIISFLDILTAQKEIKAIGLGVPGITDEGGYFKENEDAVLVYHDIGKVISKKYQLPVVLENNLNAIAIGFATCYKQKFPCENTENTNMAFLHFDKGCVSAGFICNGKIIRGCRHYAGELGLIPENGEETLGEYMARPLDGIGYTKTVSKIISWICGVLNPQYIALGGPAFHKIYLPSICETLAALLPAPMQPELLYAPDVRHDYYEGMASLTAEKIFSDVQLIKE